MFKLFPWKTNELTYLYHPDAEWRIAVSRRFNYPPVDDLYRLSILPIIETEGIVLECSFAAESTENRDFWTNRFGIILEISDIHILIDIERSANMEFEFRRSQQIARNGLTPSLANNFGWGFESAQVFIRPIRIYIKKGNRYSYSIGSRKRVINISDNDSYEDVSSRLKKAICWAKKVRLFNLRCAEILYERPITFLGIHKKEIKPTLIGMTNLAKEFVIGNNVDDLMSSAASKTDFSTDMRLPIAEINKTRQQEVKFYSGEHEDHSTFPELVREILEIFPINIRLLSKITGSDIEWVHDLEDYILSNWFLKKLINVVAFFYAINIFITRRRLRKKR